MRCASAFSLGLATRASVGAPNHAGIGRKDCCVDLGTNGQGRNATEQYEAIRGSGRMYTCVGVYARVDGDEYVLEMCINKY